MTGETNQTRPAELRTHQGFIIYKSDDGCGHCPFVIYPATRRDPVTGENRADLAREEFDADRGMWDNGRAAKGRVVAEWSEEPVSLEEMFKIVYGVIR